MTEEAMVLVADFKAFTHKWGYQAFREALEEKLYEIKKGCEAGDWTAFCENPEVDIKVPTANDHVNRYCERMGIARINIYNQQPRSPKPDPESDLRKRLVEEGKEERKGKKSTPHATQIYLQQRNLPAHLVSSYNDNPDLKAAYKKQTRALWFKLLGVEFPSEQAEGESVKTAMTTPINQSESTDKPGTTLLGQLKERATGKLKFPLKKLDLLADDDFGDSAQPLPDKAAESEGDTCTDCG